MIPGLFLGVTQRTIARYRKKGLSVTAKQMSGGRTSIVVRKYRIFTVEGQEKVNSIISRNFLCFAVK